MLAANKMIPEVFTASAGGFVAVTDVGRASFDATFWYRAEPFGCERQCTGDKSFWTSGGLTWTPRGRDGRFGPFLGARLTGLAFFGGGGLTEPGLPDIQAGPSFTCCAWGWLCEASWPESTCRARDAVVDGHSEYSAVRSGRGWNGT